MRRFLILLLALTLLPLTANAAPVRTDHIEVELVSPVTSVTPGAEITLALKQTLRPGWHTYWRNPGDSGEATTLNWILPEGFKVSDIFWPAPSRITVGPLVNYGYSGVVYLPITLAVPEDAPLGQSINLTARASWLVCKEICVPEEATLDLTLPVTAESGAQTPEARKIAAFLKRVPQTAPELKARWSRANEAIALSVIVPDFSTTMAEGAQFFPYDGALFEHAADQAVEWGASGLTLSLQPGYSLKKSSYKKPVSGALVLRSGQVFEVTAARGATLPDTSGHRPVAGVVTPPISLWLAMGFAFLGGLILNLMPCVFPVLSLKASQIVHHVHSAKGLHRQGLVFTLGVLTAFLGLAAALMLLRHGGAELGWGFQLQSPPVVMGLMLVMFAVGLNLSGVYEIGTSVQNAGSGLERTPGLLGTFFTGLLAVVVAAPCTAPFMGAALGFALTQPPLIGVAVFLALGLGMALPMLLLSFIPALAHILPRPGPWMVRFKALMAFPMYAAAAWLMWVLIRQGGEQVAALGLGAAVLLAAGLWAWGTGISRLWRGLAILFAVLALAPIWTVAKAPSPAERLAEEPYSASRLAELRAQNKPVFVYFTAAWCVTCLVNEQVALSTAEVQNTLRDGGFTVLKADWTNRDPAITAALADYGRAGVPLYLVFPARKADKPEILPQILTPSLVRNALARAEK